MHMLAPGRCAAALGFAAVAVLVYHTQPWRQVAATAPLSRVPICSLKYTCIYVTSLQLYRLEPWGKLKTRICLKLEENRQLLMAFGSAIERELGY